MSEQERQALEQEIFFLKELIRIHVEFKDDFSMSEKELEEYVNAALDRIIEIRNKLLED